MSGAAQAAVLVIAIGALVVAAWLVRRGSLKERFALLWLAIGVGMVALALARPAVDWISDRVGVEGTTTVLFAGLLFLLGLLLHLSVILSRLEERVRDVAEAHALLVAEMEERSGEAAAPVPGPDEGHDQPPVQP